MSLGAGATQEDDEIIAKLFGAVGKVRETKEKYGSGPTYIYFGDRSVGCWSWSCRFTTGTCTWFSLSNCMCDREVLIVSGSGAASMATQTEKDPGQ
uniref:Uncharacterized protein n=1 Tax=Helianthus annuus TaxID=4232 RepID=A0A251U193_HELAN